MYIWLKWSEMSSFFETRKQKRDIERRSRRRVRLILWYELYVCVILENIYVCNTTTDQERERERETYLYGIKDDLLCWRHVFKILRFFRKSWNRGGRRLPNREVYRVPRDQTRSVKIGLLDLTHEPLNHFSRKLACIFHTPKIKHSRLLIRYPIDSRDDRPS